MRRHFLGEEEQEEAPPPAPEASREWGCLLLPLTLLRSLLPPTWHVEGTTVTWRKHWVALIRKVGIPLLIFALITVVTLVAVISQDTGKSFYALVVILYAIASFVLVPWLLWQFEDWQNDFYQVTATRIIHVERLPFFLRETRREANLEQITNVRFEQSFWGRILNYGNVIVETAAPAGNFDFETASRPRKVQSEVFAHIDAARQRNQQQERDRRQAEMLDWFSIYDELRQNKPRPPQEGEGKKEKG